MLTFSDDLSSLIAIVAVCLMGIFYFIGGKHCHIGYSTCGIILFSMAAGNSTFEKHWYDIGLIVGWIALASHSMLHSVNKDIKFGFRHQFRQ